MLGVLAAVLLVLCPALGAAGAAQERADRPVVTAPEGAAGCGNGSGAGERDAQPATPPRGAASHEPPPAPSYDLHCGTAPHGRTAAVAGPVADGRPPPIPLSSEERSILRV
ncbi:hypothetical protein [Streptomyces tsukubensis]|uniref:Secreted protein n=1 Tax=Streptomyces tsukubensis (strain DSM 42081 / NBRC 108919 / NRRL 18488 / 9993) TaxID=1114943 RepID=A0A7G3UHN2_STRT9|nr:hypothetical protein [Streptomyces tsukubensis]AZK95037.1 hypothetical protein B7R87_15080 [Streptomyces tsukubensis]QKM68895.1 hypothetical protein STSU_018695 [Streptomyces tsukubensis NRRL18488]TAI43701.1 hypothetical protein EWI31_18450 [Streptomyces tsukubensis]